MTDQTTPRRQGVDLDSLIPGPSVAAGYVGRTIAGFREFDTYEAAMASGHNVLLEGDTGTGKTYSVRAFAATKGLPFYTVMMNGSLDMGVLLGAYSPTEDGKLEWVDGVITSMVREGRGVVLFDEINMAIERNIARFYDLFDARREIVLYEHHGEVLRVAPGSDFLVVAAYNPGYLGTRPLSQALPNRFAFKMEFDYDETIEAQLVVSSTLLEIAHKLRGMKREIKTPVSTNMLVEFCEIALAFSVDYAIANWCQAFPKHERQSVAQVMGLYKARLAEDIDRAARELEDL